MTEVPETEAGRALAKERDACLGVQCSHASDDAIIAIEAEARAAALDEGALRSVFIELGLFVDVLPDSPIADRRADPFPSIIDALRERDGG